MISRSPAQVVLDAGRKPSPVTTGSLLTDGGEVSDVNEEHTIVVGTAARRRPSAPASRSARGTSA